MIFLDVLGTSTNSLLLDLFWSVSLPFFCLIDKLHDYLFLFESWGQLRHDKRICIIQASNFLLVKAKLIILIAVFAGQIFDFDIFFNW